MSITLDRFCLISLFAIPAAHELSTWIGVLLVVDNPFHVVSRALVLRFGHL